MHCGGETQQLGQRKFAVLGSWVRLLPPPPIRDCSMFFIDVKSNIYRGTFGVVISTFTLIS